MGCVLTMSPLSLQLAYCVVQFMEKDATVTEYVRFPLNYLIKQIDGWTRRSVSKLQPRTFLHNGSNV